MRVQPKSSGQERIVQSILILVDRNMTQLSLLLFVSGLDDPNNVFSCKPEEECCTKNLKPACCAAMPTDMMIQDQIELWVPLAVIITLLGLFVWFCRSDQSLLDAETPCLQKFCCCLGYKKRGDDGHLHIISEDLGSSTSLKSEKSAIVSIEDDAEVSRTAK